MEYAGNSGATTSGKAGLMGGYRARGALATLALASVVLVAVVLAGTVSMAPIVQPGAPIAGGRRNNSFGVVVPGNVVASPEATPPDAGNESEPPVVVLNDADEPAGEDDPGSGLPPVFPPDPGTPPGQGPGGGPVNEPGPQPTEGGAPSPGPTASPAPFMPEPSEPPLPTEPPVIPKPRGSANRPPKAPKPPHAGPQGPKAKPPVIVVGRPDAKPPKAAKGPRWRPPEPARQSHPKQSDKWSRVGTRAKPSGQAHSRGGEPRASGRDKHRSSHRARASRPHGVMPQRSSVRQADRGHDRSQRAGHGGRRRGKDHGHRSNRGKRGRRR